MEKYEIMLVNDKIYMTDEYELKNEGAVVFVSFVDVREPKHEYYVPLNSIVYIKERMS